MTAVNWEVIILDKDFLARIDRLAFKRFHNDGLAEEASNFVLEKLAADQWARLNTFKGQSKPENFAIAIARRLVEDFARQRFGRPRPPSWLQREGETWVRIWKMLCLERRNPQDVVTTFTHNGSRESRWVEHAIKTIRRRIPNCGESIKDALHQPQAAADTNQLAETKDTTPFAARLSAEQARLRQVRDSLRITFNAPTPPTAADSPTPEASLTSEQKLPPQPLFLLTDRECLIMKMVFQDGLSRAKTALALGTTATALNKEINAALERIRSNLSKAGIELDDLLEELLNS